MPVEVVKQCVSEPPPDQLLFDVVGGKGSGCPESFAGCLSTEAAAAIGVNLDKLRTWARDTWLLCGPVPEPFKVTEGDK